MKIKSKKKETESVTLYSAGVIKTIFSVIVGVNIAVTGAEFTKFTKNSELFNEIRTVSTAVVAIMSAFGMAPTKLIRSERLKLGDISSQDLAFSTQRARSVFIPESEEEEAALQAATVELKKPAVEKALDEESEYFGLPPLVMEEDIFLRDYELPDEPDESDEPVSPKPKLFAKFLEMLLT